MKRIPMLIDGEWVAGEGDQYINVHNPASGEVVAEIVNGTAEHIDRAVKAAQQAVESAEWRAVKPFERGQLLQEMAAYIRENAETLSRLESEDVGKPLAQARSDAEAAARYFEFYGGAADKVFGDSIPIEEGLLNVTVLEPMGVTVHIIPWNYPMQIFARSVAAAIAMGNAVIVKSAEDTPQTTHALSEWFAGSRLPKGIYQHVTGLGPETGAQLVSHPGINQITFTGSVRTGISVMEAAAKNVVPVTLELGGKSPNIVFADADLEKAAAGVLNAIIQNAGQTCSAGARLLVEASIKEEFVAMLKERFERLTIGPGSDDPDLGPILNKRQFEQIQRRIEVARKEGSVLTGGEAVTVEGYENGYFIQPTMVEGIDANSATAQEEIFGPVLSIFTFSTADEAIELANSTEYGLVAGIWTANIDAAHYTAARMKAGQVFINSYGAAGGVQMPFGGYKKSGIGREKSHLALQNYVQVKNIAIKYGV